MSGRPSRRTVDAIGTLRDPWALAPALVAAAMSDVPEDLLPALREASMHLDGEPDLRALAVRALDTDWGRVADVDGELRALVAGAVDEPRREQILERIAWWRADGLAQLDMLSSSLDASGRGGYEVQVRKNGGAKPFARNGGPKHKPPDVPPPKPVAGVGPKPAAGVGPVEEPALSDDTPTAPSPYVGFTDPLDPDGILENTALRGGAQYWFWFEIAHERPAGAIDAAPAPLPPLPEDTRLQVVLFGYPGGIELPPGGLCGWIRLRADGTSAVDRQPVPDPEMPTRQGRLFFPIVTPAAPAVVRLRCNVYHRQNLLQSRLVTARLAPSPERDPGPRAVVDYAISSSLGGRQLAGLGEQRLNLMLNQNADDTHGLRFVGKDEFRASAKVDEGTLTTVVGAARAALHRAAWGSSDPWPPGGDPKKYRYGGAKDRKRLFDDLADLARAGWRLYFALCDDLAGERPGQPQDEDASDRLQELMRTPGSVHVALRQGAKHVLPAAMLYDRYLDDQRDYTICPAFADALDKPDPIGESACFQGECPSRALSTVVCASGFWGFRHRLGLPVNVDQGDDAPTWITTGAGAALTMCVSDDFKPVYEPHQAALAGLGATIRLTDDRDQALGWFGAEDCQIVYFFCHGAYTKSVPPLPALVLKSGGLVITASNLGNIRWAPPRSRPLVVMNGCHTAAHDPETILGFVDAFVKKCRAVGVIGTEITIFPSLARAFGEELFGTFLAGRSIGEAVREARLALLHKQLNPLGLVYIPYVCNGLQLRAA